MVKKTIKNLTKFSVRSLLGQSTISHISAASGIPAPTDISAGFGIASVGNVALAGKKIMKML